MHATTVAIDLAKDVFQLAYTDAERSAIEPLRVTSRLRFAALFENRAPLRIVMEACGSAHYWGRRFGRLGHTVRLLPAHDVRPVTDDEVVRLTAVFAEVLVEGSRRPGLDVADGCPQAVTDS